MRLRVPSARLPAPAALWIVLLAGHAIVSAAPLPARLAGPALVAAFAAGAASLACAAVASRRAPGIRRAPLARAEAALGILSLLAAGASLGAEADAARWPLPVHPRAVRVRIEGRVLDTVAADARSPSLRFEARRVAVGEAEAPCRARLLLRVRDEALTPRWTLPGLWIALEGDYRPPEDARNPGADAPGRRMERLGLSGTVDVDPFTVEAPSDAPERGSGVAEIVRDRIARAFATSLAPPVAALARGMILGDRSAIEPGTRDSFRDGGTIHVLSISGLHVCVLGAFALLLARALRLAGGAGLGLELALVWAYTLLVGAPASALRAAILWTAVRSGRALGRVVRPLAAWGLAGLLLHLADPQAPLDAGFQLSFAAVLGLLAAGGPGGDADAPSGTLGRLRTAAHGAASLAAQSAAATAGTFAFATRLFGALPVAGFLLNLAVVPLCGIFMGQAFLVLALGAAPVALHDAAAGALEGTGLLLLALNARGARLLPPWPIHAVAAQPAIAASLLSLLLAASFREGARHAAAGAARAARRIAVALTVAAPFLALLPSPPGPPVPAHLIAIDVGQGDALLARDGGAAILVDGGPADDGFDAGRAAVEPVLREEGIARLDLAILSHAHRDHYGGLAWLTRRGWFERLAENGSDPHGAWRAPIARGVARRGADAAGALVIARDTLLPAGDLRVALRAPPDLGADPGRGNALENNRSVAALLALGGAGVFLPGDAEHEAEAATLGLLAPVEILKAPHHGSRTSSDARWLERLAPRLVLVSCGEGNRFGHPDRGTLGRYRLLGAAVYRTDLEGAVRVSPGSGGAWVSTRRHPAPVFVRFERVVRRGDRDPSASRGG